MLIEIHQPKLEALIGERMASGHFKNIEDALIQALESAPLPAGEDELSPRTGADLVAAMRSMPYKDDIEFEHQRPRMPIRDVEF